MPVFVQPQPKVAGEVREIAVIEYLFGSSDAHGFDDVDELPPVPDHWGQVGIELREDGGNTKLIFLVCPTGSALRGLINRLYVLFHDNKHNHRTLYLLNKGWRTAAHYIPKTMMSPPSSPWWLICSSSATHSLLQQLYPNHSPARKCSLSDLGPSSHRERCFHPLRLMLGIISIGLRIWEGTCFVVFDYVLTLG